MIADSKELQIILKYRDEAKAGLLKSGKDFDDFANKHQGVLNKCMAHWQLFAAAGAIAFGVVAGAAAVGIKEYTEHQTAMAQVEAGIKSTGGAAGVTAKELEKYADTVQRKVAIDDEDILNMQSILLTFPLLKNQVGATNDVFNQSSLAALNLSTRLGKDLPSAAIMIGKALTDPVAGVTALRRVGVMLNDQQKDNIKTMVEQGNLLGAQKVILAELTTEVGGSAEAYGKTLPGSLDKVKFAFADMAETLVSNNLPAFEKVANEVSSFLWKMADTGTLAGLFGKGMEVALHAVQALVNIMEGKNATFNTIANAFKWIATEAIHLAPTLLKVAAAFEAFKIINVVRSAIANLGVSLAGMSGSLGQAGGALAFFSNPIGAAIGGVALLAGGIYLAVHAHSQHEKATKAAAVALGQYKNEMRDSALSAQTLVTEYSNLQGVVASSTATDEEKAAAQVRLNELVGQIADILPGARTGWNDEGQAILVNVDAMNQLIDADLKYAGIKVGAKGEAGRYEAVDLKFGQTSKEGAELDGIIKNIGKTMGSMEAEGKKVFTSTEVNKVTAAYSRNAAEGDKVWKVLADAKGYMTGAKQPWQETNLALEQMAALTGKLEGKYTEYGFTAAEVGKILGENKAQLKAVGDAMVAAAGEAGKAGGPMGKGMAESIGSALQSVYPEVRQVGTQTAAKYAEGLFAAQGQVGAEATGMAQHLANLIATGADYDGTGGAIGKQVYDGVKAQLAGAGIVITPIVDSEPAKAAFDQVLNTFENFITGKHIDAKVNVDDSEAKTRIADLNKVPLDEKTARLLADGSQAQNRIQQIIDIRIPDKHFNIIGDPGTKKSPFVQRSPTEIGKWMAEGIAAGYAANAAPLQAPVSGGGGPPAGGLVQAWDTAAAALKSYIDEMNLAEAPFADADAAVQKLASTDMAWATQEAQLNAGRDTQIKQLERQALLQEDANDKAGAEATRNTKSAVERLKNESELQLELSQTTVLNQKIIDDWNTLKGVYNNATDALDDATAAVDKYNAAETTLNKLKEVRIKGEMKLENESFALQQKISNHHLAVLKAEQAYSQQTYELDKLINAQNLAMLQNPLAAQVRETEYAYAEKTFNLQQKADEAHLAMLQNPLTESARVGREGQADADYEYTQKSNATKLAMLGIEEKVRLGIATKEDYTVYEKAKTDQDAYDRQKELLDLQADINLAPLEQALKVAERGDEALSRQKELLDLQKTIATASPQHQLDLQAQAAEELSRQKELLDLQKTIATAPDVRREEADAQAKAIADLKTDILFAPMKRTLDKIFNPQTEKAFSNLLAEATKARTAMTKLGDLTKLQKSVDNMKGIIDKLGTYFKTLLTKVGSKQSGGYIYSQGLYELHAGERVQTAKEVSHEISGGGEIHYHLYNPVFNDVRNVESFMKQLGQRTESLQRVPS